ncbi:MAG: hypothetical protein ACI4C1_01475 [Lachnospiraceae bacterium]
MNTLIEQLYAIEQDAASVRAQTDSQKKVIAAQMEQKTSEYDKILQQSTADTIAKLQTDLNKQIQFELSAQETATQQTLQQLENNYVQNHTTLADSILQTILMD